MYKIATFCVVILMIIFIYSSISFASLTKEQSEDIAAFAMSFIEKGNQRRDANGYPLLVYALSNNGNTCIEIRRRGYNEELYHVYNNNYHKRNGYYLDLGNKWCMDCGDFISYVYHKTLGLDLMIHPIEDPWHIKDMYNDAKKGNNSQFFEFIYKDVPISSINENNLEKGDIILRMGSRENHGLIYVGENMQAAHASRNGIKYSAKPLILGFEIVQFNRFYKTSTIVSIVRLKDGIISNNQKVKGIITWPDTGELEDLLPKDDSILDKIELEQPEIKAVQIPKIELNNQNTNIEIKEKREVLYWVSEEIKKFLLELKKDSENTENL